MTPLLDVKNLSVSFRGEGGIVTAIHDVSFSINKGETLGVVGESGSGKSLTSLAILGLIPNPPGFISGGEIVFDGVDLRKVPSSQLRAIRGKRIAMIFQDPMSSLNPVLTIGQQIGESLQLHLGMSKRSALAHSIELLDLVGIPSPHKRVHEYPHEFSGGMRQRVMIAMALSCNPELLIADEPTTALDVTIQAQILELIDQLRQEFGTAVMLITHDLGLVAGKTDRVVVMYAGRIVEEARTEQLFETPMMPYTRGLLDSLPRLEHEPGHKLVPIPGQPPQLGGRTDICPFHPRCRQFTPGLCDAQRPQLELVGPSHHAACLLLQPWAATSELKTPASV